MAWRVEATQLSFGGDPELERRARPLDTRTALPTFGSPLFGCSYLPLFAPFASIGPIQRKTQAEACVFVGRFVLVGSVG